jgi:hypothetical protein
VRHVAVFESPDELQLDMPRVSGFKEPAACAQQDRNETDFQLVELARPKQRLRYPCAVHHHRAVACCGAGLRSTCDNVGEVSRVARQHIAVVRVMGEHVDRYAVVVVALPAIGEFEGAPSRDHGPGRHELAEDLPAGPCGHLVVEPVVEPPAVAAEALALPVVRPSDEAVE